MALAKVCKSWDSERAESNDICFSAAANCIPSDLMRVCVGQRRTKKTSGLWTLDAIDRRQYLVPICTVAAPCAIAKYGA